MILSVSDYDTYDDNNNSVLQKGLTAPRTKYDKTDYNIIPVLAFVVETEGDISCTVLLTQKLKSKTEKVVSKT